MRAVELLPVRGLVETGGGESEMNEKTHLDLFSGIGGFSIAAANCGFRTIAFCEREPYAQQVLKEKFGAVMADAESGKSGQPETGNGRKDSGGRSPQLHPDIFTLNGADYAGVDLLTGGFPCQPYSVAGKRKGASDDRALWPEMCRVIAEATPAFVLGENVAGIVTMELDRVLADLEAIGYAVWPLVIPAVACDARHRRDRVWIIGRRIVADADKEREPRLPKRAQAQHAGPWFSGQDVADTNGPLGTGNQCPNGSNQERANNQQPCWWLPESGFCRVAHGIPARAHRLRALGNAIVPQVAEEIIRAMIISPCNPKPGGAK